MRICDLCGWSSEKEPQKPQNGDIVCPLPRGAKTPKIYNGPLSRLNSGGRIPESYTTHACCPRILP
ncbi:MAG: hypothetical protein MUF54_04130, partial [Polyangiaceae bacterium]|nr:hypothetical protein [Polyangiaceae bacterium]